MNDIVKPGPTAWDGTIARALALARADEQIQSLIPAGEECSQLDLELMSILQAYHQPGLDQRAWVAHAVRHVMTDGECGNCPVEAKDGPVRPFPG
jgi:hypothetical protein